ncbi:uncharacterized protein LOC123565997 [Mercenaria mercenaria]|uniref:uncharacterized protein LOC123565997 n=1 Tax=Mercenaria mercenaria TaxID=6596 RepID=UPI00234EF8CB|nr:uncharacterized protein LOC123565997 [Mercenaria mercenaria]
MNLANTIMMHKADNHNRGWRSGESCVATKLFFRKFQKDKISLFALIQLFYEMIREFKELSYKRTSVLESMLQIMQHIMSSKVRREILYSSKETGNPRSLHRYNMAVSGRKAMSSSTLSRGCAEDYEIFCQPCDLDDLRLPAFGFCKDCEEHLCESCFNHHKKAKPSRHHILLDEHNMPQNLQVQSKSANADELKTPCPKHKKEIIKFFCHDHENLLCNVCVTLDHTRTSCQVDYIPDISKKSLKRKEITETLKNLDVVTERYKRATVGLKEKLNTSTKFLKDVLLEIKSFRKEINKRIDEWEKKVIEIAKDIQRENDTRLKIAETKCNDVTKSLETSSDYIKQLNASKQADKLFIELKSAEKLIRDQEKKLSKLLSPDIIEEFCFQPNPAINSALQDIRYLGTIKHKETELSAPSPPTVTLPRFSHQGDICVDKEECWISGMALLTPSRLVLTDEKNNCIKMVDLSNGSITDYLQLDTPPLDITTVTSNQLAVTLSDKEIVQFISASSNKLSLKQKFKVDGDCSGISCYQDKLVVTFDDPIKIQIFDLKGKVLTTITNDSVGKNFYLCIPRHATSNGQSIYVCEARMFQVYRFSWEGKPTGRYSDIRSPSGIAMLNDGSILVSDSDNGNIQHISRDVSGDIECCRQFASQRLDTAEEYSS